MAAAPTPPTLPLTADTLLEWLAGDVAAFQGLKDQDKGALLARTPDAASAASGFKATQNKLHKRIGFAWQWIRSTLPTEVLDDINNFADDSGLPRTDPDNPTAALPPLEKGNDEHLLGECSVTINGDELEFSNAELAPPAGVAGKNCSR